MGVVLAWLWGHTRRLAADTIAICAGVAPIDLASCSTCTSEEFS